MTLFPCPLGCGEFVKKMDLKFHKRFLCPNRRISCRFSEFCQMNYFAHAQSQHERNECQRLDVRNSYLDASELKNATELCELCAEPVRVRDLDEHNKNLCPFRTVPCQYADCKDLICANQLKHHLKLECKSRELKRTTMLINRARKRLNYPRPWGFEMTLIESNEEEPDEDGTKVDRNQLVMNDSDDDEADQLDGRSTDR